METQNLWLSGIQLEFLAKTAEVFALLRDFQFRFLAICRQAETWINLGPFHGRTDVTVYIIMFGMRMDTEFSCFLGSLIIFGWFWMYVLEPLEEIYPSQVKNDVV